MNELALRYEYIIRAAHNVGRLEIPAAHADAYRALEHSYVINRDNTKPAESEKLLFQYAYMCGEISTNLSNAVWKFEKDFFNNLTQDDKDKLNQIEDLLIYGSMNNIDDVIPLFEEVLRNHGRIV